MHGEIGRKFQKNSSPCSGKVLVSDFVEEMLLVDIEMGEEEIKKLSDFADKDGQINKAQFTNFCQKSELFMSLDK